MERDEGDFILADLDVIGNGEAVGEVDRHIVDGCIFLLNLGGKRVGVADVVNRPLVSVVHMEDKLQLHAIVYGIRQVVAACGVLKDPHNGVDELPVDGFAQIIDAQLVV